MKIRSITARLVLAATLPAVGLVAVSGTAHAQKPRSGNTPATCDVYNENTGKIEQVPEGSRVGLFYCGQDGEWHVGWLVDARVGGTTTPPKPKASLPRSTTVVTAAVR